MTAQSVSTASSAPTRRIVVRALRHLSKRFRSCTKMQWLFRFNLAGFRYKLLSIHKFHSSFYYSIKCSSIIFSVFSSVSPSFLSRYLNPLSTILCLSDSLSIFSASITFLKSSCPSGNERIN